MFVVKYSADGKYIASGLGDGSIRVRTLPGWMGAAPRLHVGVVPVMVLRVRSRSSVGSACAGVQQVLNTATGHTHVLGVGTGSRMPVTSLRFRPVSAASKTKNVLLAVGECAVLAPARPRPGACGGSPRLTPASAPCCVPGRR